jgi:hypothetical protein
VKLPVDHLAIWAPDRDRLVERIAELTGLPAWDGFQPGGVITSRGVRFPGGPFLDIFQSEGEETYLGLAGDIEAAEALSEAQGWRRERERRPDPPADDDAPWDILYWARNRGVFSRLFLIDYRTDRAAFDAPSYCGPLHKPWLVPEAGPRLARVHIAVHDPALAARHLRALGFTPAGPWGEDAARFSGATADLVLVPVPPSDPEHILGFDVDGALAAADETFGPLRLHAAS